MAEKTCIMGKNEKLIFQILRGMNDANIAFADLVNLLKQFGFDMRTKGSIIFSGKPVLVRKSICRKKGIKQSLIKFGKYAILFSNTNWETKANG